MFHFQVRERRAFNIGHVFALIVTDQLARFPSIFALYPGEKPLYYVTHLAALCNVRHVRIAFMRVYKTDKIAFHICRTPQKLQRSHYVRAEGLPYCASMLFPSVRTSWQLTLQTWLTSYVISGGDSFQRFLSVHMGSWPFALRILEMHGLGSCAIYIWGSARVLGVCHHLCGTSALLMAVFLVWGEYSVCLLWQSGSLCVIFLFSWCSCVVPSSGRLGAHLLSV